MTDAKPDFAAMNNESTLDMILDLSRQNQIGELTPWFKERLVTLIEEGVYPSFDNIDTVIIPKIIEDLRKYAAQTGVNTVVLGMSGGVDSALTAALFKEAGWRVIGVTMPIHQVQAETDRGIEACKALGIEHLHADLSALYDATLRQFAGTFSMNIDKEINDDELAAEDKAIRVRRGNVRARLRMVTLYNLAAKHGGLVASTDNLSELSAGFWTLHGDVGDLSPIQSLTKSWEVPIMAMLMGVPESTYRATPTDGLGIDAGDEAQLGASYLEWDIMFFSMNDKSVPEFPTFGREADVLDALVSRMRGTWFKRMNPVNLRHPTQDRFGYLEELDQTMRPQMFS